MVFGLWHVVSLMALAMDVEPVKAYGYACGVGAVQVFQIFLFLFVTKEVESLGMPRAPMLFWLLFHAVNVERNDPRFL